MQHRAHTRHLLCLLINSGDGLLFPTGADVQTLSLQQLRQRHIHKRFVVHQTVLRMNGVLTALLDALFALTPVGRAVAVLQVGHTALLLRTKHAGLIGDLLTVELLEQSLRICRLDGKGPLCLPLAKIIDDCAVVGDDRQGDAAACRKVIHAVQVSSRSHRQPNSLLHQPDKQLSARLG